MNVGCINFAKKRKAGNYGSKSCSFGNKISKINSNLRSKTNFLFIYFLDCCVFNDEFAILADGKYSRAENDASTVATTLSQSQANTQAHGQAFLNPAAALPPGYGYYFAGGMMTGGIHHYAPPIFPVS